MNNRHRTTGVLLTAAVLVTTGLLVGGCAPAQSGPIAIVSLPPASPSVVGTDFRDVRWRLTAVTDGRAATEIPASVGAWLRLSSGGEVTAFDGVNTLSGRFTPTSDGFTLVDVLITLIGYDGDAPALWAASQASSALMENSEVTVLSADSAHLEIQTAGVRLTFSSLDG